MADATFPATNAYQGLDTVLAIIDFYGLDTSGATHTYSWAGMTHSGATPIDGRVVSFGRFSRSLSDIQGQYQGASFEFTLSDYDQQFRRFATQTYQRHLTNTEVVVKVITAADLKAGNTPIVVARGLLTKWNALPGMLIQCQCEDLLTSAWRVTLPYRTVTSAFWTNNLGVVEPIVYGDVWYSVGGTKGDDSGGFQDLYYLGDVVVGINDDITGIGVNNYTFAVFLVAGHACKSIDNIYVDGVEHNAYANVVSVIGAGVDADIIGVPGMGNWSKISATDYIDVVGTTGETRRYTLIYACIDSAGTNDYYKPDAICTDLKAGTKRLACDVQGIEDVGDGSGTLIDDGALALKHLCRNYVFPDADHTSGYLTGNWASSVATWADSTPRVLESTMGSAGLLLSCVLNQSRTKRDTVASFLRHLSADGGWNRKQQFFLTYQNTDTAPSGSLTETNDILEGFQWTEDPAALFNVFPYGFGSIFRAGGRSDILDSEQSPCVNDVSLLDIKDRKECSRLSYEWTYWNGNVLSLEKRVAQSNPAPRFLDVPIGLPGLTTDLGDVVRVYHREAPGAPTLSATTSWRLARVEQLTVDLNSLSILARVRDLEYFRRPMMSAIQKGLIVGGTSMRFSDFITRGIRDLYFDWDLAGTLLPGGFTVKVRWWGKVTGTRNYTPLVHNETDNSDDGTGSAVSSTSWPANGSEQLITLSAKTGIKRYTLRGGSLSGSGNGYAYAWMEVVPT